MIKYINFSTSTYSKKFLCVGETDNRGVTEKNKVLVVLHITDTNKSISQATADVKCCLSIIDKVKSKCRTLEFSYISYDKCVDIKNDSYSDFINLQEKVNSFDDFYQNYRAVIFFHNNRIEYSGKKFIEQISALEKFSGKLTENNIIPISIGIGDNSELQTSSSFSGMYNNFLINNNSNYNITSIIRAVNSQMIYISDIKQYIPAYDNKFYYICHKVSNDYTKIFADKFYIHKYINLVIMEKILEHKFNSNEIQEIIDPIIKSNDSTQNINYYNNYYSVLKTDLDKCDRSYNSHKLKMINCVVNYV